MRLSAVFAIFLTYAACDSGNTHWKVVSHPSGSGSHSQGGVIVVVHSSFPATETSDWVLQTGELKVSGRTVRAWLLTEVPGDQADDEEDNPGETEGESGRSALACAPRGGKISETSR